MNFSEFFIRRPVGTTLLTLAIAIQNLLCEVKPGCGRCDGSYSGRKDGLIARLVQSLSFTAFAFNVGRQRCGADLVNDPVKVTLAVKTDVTTAFFQSGSWPTVMRKLSDLALVQVREPLLVADDPGEDLWAAGVLAASAHHQAAGCC